MSRAFRVNVLGAALEIVCDESVPDDAADEFQNLWADHVDERPIPVDRLSVAISAGPKPGIHLVAATAATLAASLTSHMTMRGLVHNRGRKIMLHAAGVALPDGRVIALVGPSGRGKTTAVRALGSSLGYVTDETIAVSIDPETYGKVLAFRKPLSLVNGAEPKRQVSPSELGLQPLPAAPLRLAAIVLLSRDDSPTAGTSTMAHVEPVGLVQALRDVTPQMSYLPEITDPLGTLARLIADTGGVRRVHYCEASTLAAAVPVIVAATQSDPEQGPSGTVAPTHDLRTAGTWLPVARVHWLDLGEALVTLRGREVHGFGGVAPVLWRHLLERGPLGLDDLVTAAVAAFGDPDGEDAVVVVRGTLDRLVELGVLRTND